MSHRTRATHRRLPTKVVEELKKLGDGTEVLRGFIRRLYEKFPEQARYGLVSACAVRGSDASWIGPKTTISVVLQNGKMVAVGGFVRDDGKDEIFRIETKPSDRIELIDHIMSKVQPFES